MLIVAVLLPLLMLGLVIALTSYEDHMLGSAPVIPDDLRVEAVPVAGDTPSVLESLR
ncbi:hypothetical protein ACFWXK_00845 [Streptomyces sp. NPDC059070]|uniref:hypothetical protein n=1 Tax=Streptomyces sp. NPDC059070 TaxID=3346713 RepID=UPI00369DC87F